MGKPGTIIIIIAILGTVVNLYATAVAQGINDTLTDNPEDFEDALGNIFAFFILLIFWAAFALVAMFLLIIGKLYKQHILIVLANGILVAVQWYFVAYVLFDNNTGSTLELIKSILFAFLPLTVTSLMVVFGIANRNEA